MINENIRSLIGYRMEQAEEALNAAETLLKEKSLRASVNRSYYAMLLRGFISFMYKVSRDFKTFRSDCAF